MDTNKKALRVFVFLTVVGVLPLLSCREYVTPVTPDFTPLGKNAQGYEEFREERTGIVFVKLPGGKFQMGSPASEAERHDDEGPVHEVTLSPFLIAKYEVTQAQWKRVMGTSPSHFKGKDLPVEQVSWGECQEFCKKTGLSLPTEAQWEYACRAGTNTPFSFGATITSEQVNYNGKYPYGGAPKGLDRRKTVAVGSLPANGFGLHDMHGNVWEWCEDVYDANFYGTPAAAGPDPVSTSGSGDRVDRGGSWSNSTGYCRSANRFGAHPGIRSDIHGFRSARPLP